MAIPWSLLISEWHPACPMCNASLISNVVVSQAQSNIGWWCSVHACSAMEDLSIFPRLHAAWCSLRWVSKLLLVYARPQPHGILYIIPAFLRMGTVSFTLVSCWRMVLMVVNTVWILNLLHTLLMFSLTPTMNGRRMIYLGGSSSIAFLLSLAALWITWLGYSLDLRTIFRCSSSFWRFSPLAMVLALWKRHEATPLFMSIGWCEEYWRYLSVWVFFLYPLVSTLPPVPRVRSISRKERCPSSNSMVNWMVGRKLLLMSQELVHMLPLHYAKRYHRHISSRCMRCSSQC